MFCLFLANFELGSLTEQFIFALSQHNSWKTNTLLKHNHAYKYRQITEYLDLAPF